jgi:hypothetical protein
MYISGLKTGRNDHHPAAQCRTMVFHMYVLTCFVRFHTYSQQAALFAESGCSLAAEGSSWLMDKTRCTAVVAKV